MLLKSPHWSNQLTIHWPSSAAAGTTSRPANLCVHATAVSNVPPVVAVSGCATQSFTVGGGVGVAVNSKGGTGKLYVCRRAGFCRGKVSYYDILYCSNVFLLQRNNLSLYHLKNSEGNKVKS